MAAGTPSVVNLDQLLAARSPRILGQYLSGGALEGLRRHWKEELECDDEDVAYQLYIAREKIWEKIVEEAPSNHNWLDVVLPFLFDAKQGNDGGLSEFWADMEGLMSDALRKHDTTLMLKLVGIQDELTRQHGYEAENNNGSIIIFEGEDCWDGVGCLGSWAHGNFATRGDRTKAKDMLKAIHDMVTSPSWRRTDKEWKQECENTAKYCLRKHLAEPFRLLRAEMDRSLSMGQRDYISLVHGAAKDDKGWGPVLKQAIATDRDRISDLRQMKGKGRGTTRRRFNKETHEYLSSALGEGGPQARRLGAPAAAAGGDRDD